MDNFYGCIKFNKFGIQQGSVLFLIYMNDIFSVTFQVKTAAIANDTAYYIYYTYGAATFDTLCYNI